MITAATAAAIMAAKINQILQILISLKSSESIWFMVNPIKICELKIRLGPNNGHSNPGQIWIPDIFATNIWRIKLSEYWHWVRFWDAISYIRIMTEYLKIIIFGNRQVDLNVCKLNLIIWRFSSRQIYFKIQIAFKAWVTSELLWSIIEIKVLKCFFKSCNKQYQVKVNVKFDKSNIYVVRVRHSLDGF